MAEGLRGRLLPAVSLQSPDEQVALLHCVSRPDTETSHLVSGNISESILCLLYPQATKLALSIEDFIPGTKEIRQIILIKILEIFKQI